MLTKTPSDDVDKLLRRFTEWDSVNPKLALNFLLGSLGTQLRQGNSITPEKIQEILERSLRFSRIRK